MQCAQRLRRSVLLPKSRDLETCRTWLLASQAAILKTGIQDE